MVKFGFPGTTNSLTFGNVSKHESFSFSAQNAHCWRDPDLERARNSSVLAETLFLAERFVVG
jgi:hypothetical protein